MDECRGYVGLVVRKGEIRVGVILTGPSHAARVSALQMRLGEFERQLQMKLDLTPHSTGTKSTLTTSGEFDITRRATWATSHEWIVTVAPRVFTTLRAAIISIDEDIMIAD